MKTNYLPAMVIASMMLITPNVSKAKTFSAIEERSLLKVMKIMSHRLIAIFLFLWSSSISAQESYKVSGTIKECGSNNPLKFCKIYVSDSTGNQVKRTISLKDGAFGFECKNGVYNINITSTGHKSASLQTKVNGKDMVLPDIFLETGEEIAASAVTEKNLLRRRGDRYVYNVAADPDANKVSMMTIMSKIPKLVMSNKSGNLEFEGKPLMKILIDGEESGLISVNRQYPMEFIKAEYMKQIELVLPGSNEYQNSEPILLIKLAKDLPYGFAGSLQASADTKNSYNPSADIVINTPIIGIGVGYNWQYSGQPALSNKKVLEYDNESLGSITSTQSLSSTYAAHNLNLNLFRNMAKDKLKINVSLSTQKYFSTSNSESARIYKDASGLETELSSTSMSGTGKSPFRLNGGLRLSGNFGPAGPRGRGKNSWRAEYSYSDSQNTDS